MAGCASDALGVKRRTPPRENSDVPALVLPVVPIGRKSQWMAEPEPKDFGAEAEIASASGYRTIAVMVQGPSPQ